MAASVGIAFSGLLLLLLLVGAVVAVVVLLAAGGRKTRLITGGILAGVGVPVVLGMGLFLSRYSAPVRRQVAPLGVRPPPYRPIPDVPSLLPRQSTDPAIWIKSDSTEFLADVSVPASRRAPTTRGLASQTVLPARNAGTVSSKVPSSRTGQ